MSYGKLDGKFKKNAHQFVQCLSDCSPTQMTGSMKAQRIYLDHNATSPLLADARAAMLAALTMTGNPSSVHAEGRAIRAMVNAARAEVADLCGAEPSQVIFTSGATEAANHLLTPCYLMGRSALDIGGLFVSAVEHPCVLSGGRFLAENVTVLPVDRSGCLDLSALKAGLAGHDRDRGLPMLALQLANNETGVIQPVAEAARIVHEYGGLLVVDAVQGAGRLALSRAALGADFLFLSSHKLGGPVGVGAIVAAGQALMPIALMAGGGQEKGHRGGTENAPAIAGFGAAARAAGRGLEAVAYVRGLRDDLERRLRALAYDIVIHGQTVDRLANTSFFSLPGLKSETAQIGFDMDGIAVSSGSACASGKVGPSHVLKAMGADPELGAIRISLAASTTQADIERFVSAFATINRRRLSRRPAEAA